MPFEFMYDWLEKVAPVDCQTILMAFKSSGKLSLSHYNQALRNLRLEAYECRDGPFPVREGDKKLSGKALFIALHVWLMPLVVTSLVELEEDCELVQLLATIRSINEIILCLRMHTDFRL
jgi:hypothetical protein